jgi:CBS domain-containing protein
VGVDIGPAEVKDSESALARDVMSVEVICCFEDESVEHARRLMSEYNVRRLPVIDRDHHLVGFINVGDTEGRAKPVKKAIKVTFHKEKTDSYGRPHKVPIETVYITGVKNKEAAEAAAVKRLEEEERQRLGSGRQQRRSREEPVGIKKETE